MTTWWNRISRATGTPGASDYGVQSKREWGSTKDNTGNVTASFRWEPPIKSRADLAKLKPRTFSVNREATLTWKAHLEDLFADIMPVRLRGGFWWTTGMTITAVDLIGLEELMLWMYDEPEGLHELMAFLRDDHIAYAEWLEREGLLTLNNESDYIGSGSRGFTHDLPRKDWNPGDPVRLKDIWVLSESQETVGVGPKLFHEYIFPYQKPVIEKFGLAYYGCCEPVNNRWDSLKQFENLRSVSVSPWCNEAVMAEALGRNYVYSRKPNPTLISTEVWDEDLIRADIRKTLTTARQCNVEVIMKDVHTLAGQPWRMARWVALAREVIAELGWEQMEPPR